MISSGEWGGGSGVGGFSVRRRCEIVVFVKESESNAESSLRDEGREWRVRWLIRNWVFF